MVIYFTFLLTNWTFFYAALGQVMLYVDGMNGVIEHSETIQWLYGLITSEVRDDSAPRAASFKMATYIKSLSAKLCSVAIA